MLELPKLSRPRLPELVERTERHLWGFAVHGTTTVECKTGYIRGVSCLSGRVVSPDGQQYLFSVLGNNLVGDGVSRARKLQEDVVTRLVRDLEGRLKSAQREEQRSARGSNLAGASRP